MQQYGEILISVQTVNMTKEDCANKIRKTVIKYAHKYVLRKQINIIQYGEIINRATVKLADKYQMDKSVIKKTVHKFIIHVLAKAAHYERKAKIVKVEQNDFELNDKLKTERA